MMNWITEVDTGPNDYGRWRTNPDHWSIQRFVYRTDRNGHNPKPSEPYYRLYDRRKDSRFVDEFETLKAAQVYAELQEYNYA